MVYPNSNLPLEKMLLQFMSENDPMLSMLKWLCEKLMEVEVDAKINAALDALDVDDVNALVKTGAEIPFTRYFYKYQASTPSEELETKFMELEFSVSKRVAKLFE